MILENRVVVIPGATGGLGRVVAASFANQGARLALLGTNAAKLETLASELSSPVDRILTQVADLQKSTDAMKAAKAVMAKFGNAEIIINLVGGWIGGKKVIDGNDDDIAFMLQQHLWTTLYLAQAFVPHLIANGWGRFIVVSSPTAVQPKAGSVAYAVGKAAQEALMLTLAQECKDTGVTANILHVHTIDVKHERLREPTSKNASWATPEEIASAILYLCSDEAQVVNGARIPLYGSP